MNQSLAAINFADLEEKFYKGTPAFMARDLYWAIRDRSVKVDLGDLLRHHNIRGVSNPWEIEMREAFDELLAFYSLVEIGCLISFIPEPPSHDLWHEAGEILNDHPVSVYYERWYPLLLPSLLRMRIAGSRKLKENSDSEPSKIFLVFLGQEERFRRDSDVALFLKMIDSFTISGIGLDDVLNTLKDQESALDELLQGPDKRTVLGRSLQGLQKLIAYLLALDDLLIQADNWPLLQSGIWHYYAYWFQQRSRDLRSKLNNVVNLFLEWQLDDAEKDGRDTLESYVSHVQLATRRLTSGRYGEALTRAFKG